VVLLLLFAVNATIKKQRNFYRNSLFDASQCEKRRRNQSKNFIENKSVAKRLIDLQNFFQEMYEIYVKHAMNPFYETNAPIRSNNFDKKCLYYAKRFLN
jgi:hypothetical protein